jgi:bifunctional non-homologous end joining protein LigD
VKIKTVQKGKFPIVGFVKDPSGVAALYLGKIRRQLDTVVSPKSKLTKAIRKPKATWVEPTFYVDVEYRDVTSDGLLRASSFKGLSKDGK